MESSDKEDTNATSIDLEENPHKAKSEHENTQVDQLKDEIQALEQLVAELEAINQQQKDQINRLQKERIRKSVIMEKPIDMETLQQSENPKPNEKFDKMFQTDTGIGSLNSAQISLHSVNTLVCAHQLLYTEDSIHTKESNTSIAEKIAFNYMLEFIRQINEKKMNSNENIEIGYPINWLLSLFPYNTSIIDKKSESTASIGISDNRSMMTSSSIWLPLHFALAIDTNSTSTSNYNSTNSSSKYIKDLKILLEEYGSLAFEEDVSPLSIAVSLVHPNLEAVRLILDYRPDSVYKNDEDGSLPLMHACANNENIEIIEYLYSIYPAALTVLDSYGCAAIHYAAYSGTPCIVEYLINISIDCLNIREGNGALPLHDAVQNQRNISETEEIVRILLHHSPIAARQRDDLGAFPLHKAVKSATLNVVQMIYKAFPKAVFGADSEGLLPVHYVAERADKDQHLDLLQFIVEANPQSKVLDDTALFAVESSAGSTGTGWRGAMLSMWGSGAKSSNNTSTSAASSSSSSANISNPLSTNANGSGASNKIVHNRRKSVRPVRASIHEQYQR